MENSTVLKLIPEDSDAGNASEWLEKVDLVCELRKILDVATALLFRLTGRAPLLCSNSCQETRRAR